MADDMSQFTINISHVSHADYVNFTVVAIFGIAILIALMMNSETHHWVHWLRILLVIAFISNLGITIKQLKKESNAEIATVVKTRKANVAKVKQLNQQLTTSQLDVRYWGIKANDAVTNKAMKADIKKQMAAETKTSQLKQQISSLNASINAVKSDGSPAK